MSASVTPRRRRRSIDDVDGDADEISIDGEESLIASTPKRARRSIEDEASQSPEAPLLPDSFRRSPKGKGRANAPVKHQPGSIVRVKLTDFVTYSQAEFNPGPNLNMIIGPNGTGKSTLVCAIALGLGSPTSVLGRAKDVGEFVKHGCNKAEIEIELAANPNKHTKNPVITAKITRDRTSPDFFVDGRKTSKKELEKLMRSFSIQVNNLCQFLPQDRVVEFAALNPIALLAETERAAAPQYMVDWHEQLKVMRREQKDKLSQQQEITEHLKSMEKRQASQEGDVVRLRERAEHQDRIAALERCRPFPEYRATKQRWKEANKRQKEAQLELQALKDQAQPNLQAEQDKAKYLKDVEKSVVRCGKLVERGEQNAEKIRKDHDAAQTKVEDAEKELQAEKDSVKATRQKVPEFQRGVRVIQNSMQHPPADIDFAAMNEQIREKNRLARDLSDQEEAIKTQDGSLAQQMRYQVNIVNRAEEEKQHSQTQAGQQANKLRGVSQQSHQAWEWIQANRNQFQSEVFGPPIVECSVANPRHAAAVENAIGFADMKAFTVTCGQDFKMLQNQLYKTMRLNDVNIRSSTQPLDSFRSPCPKEQLQSLGLESYILDLVEGPEPVLAMLCDNKGLQATAFTSRDLPPHRVEFLSQPNSPITSWVTPSESCRISRRREYGDKASSTSTQALKPAKIFLDTPTAHQEDAELERRINDAKRAYAEFKSQQAELRAEHTQLMEQRRHAQQEEKRLKDEKNEKQSQRAQFNALPAKLEKAQRLLQEARATIDSSAEVQRELVNKGDKLALEKGQLALDYANAVDALRNLHVSHIEAQICAIEAQSDLQQLRARTQAEKAMLAERERETVQLKQTAEVLLAEAKRHRAVCESIDVRETDLISAVYDEVEHWMPDQLETEIQSVQARLDMTDGAGNQHVVREYEERAKKIEKKRSQLADVEEVLEGLEAQIREIREQWEPQLDRLIAQISEAFAENFGKIQCAGEVAVHKDEDFEAWAIQIKVKFREHEQLSILDSHRQSGGERAVSTIFYLMALQSLARAPFRVVDEINQGMDPRNERLVHSRMVDIACSEQSASQYFLITPKLLNGLKYHEGMKVHCIASGEYMPDDHRELDFGMLAKRAVEVRGMAG